MGWFSWKRRPVAASLIAPTEATSDERAGTLRLAALLGLVGTVALFLAGALDPLERWSQELKFRLLTTPASGSLVIVGFDAESLKRQDGWPWPRRLLARAIDNLHAAGARRVAVDLDLSTPSAEADDRLLAASLARAPVPVVLPVFERRPARGGSLQLVQARPLPEFERHAEVAVAQFPVAVDGLVREAATLVTGATGDTPLIAWALADWVEPPAGRFAIDYGIDLAGVPQLSMIDVVENRFDPGAVAGRNIVIGATAPELHDQFQVPVHGTVSGVAVHALIYESLVQGRALRPLGKLPVLGALLALFLVTAPLLLRLDWRPGLSVVGGVFLLCVGASTAGQALGYLVQAGPSLVFAIICYGAVQIARLDQRTLKLIRQAASLERSHRLMASLLETNNDGIVTLDVDHRVLSANAAVCTMFGYDKDDLVGRAFASLVTVEGRLFGQQGGDALSPSKGQETRSLIARRRDGSSFPVELSVSQSDEQAARRLDDGSILVIVRDISEQRRYERELQHQAMHDALTGLPNRSLLQDRLDQQIRLCQRTGAGFGLALLDLDRFKDVNDTLGHNVGDELLCDVAERLKKPLRDSDTVARLGGDEFAVLLPLVHTPAQAIAAAERIRQPLLDGFSVAGLEVEVGGSVGVALYPQHAQDAAGLLQCADVAMYVAKRAQSGVTLYTEEQDQNSVRHLILTGALRQAIRQRELVYHYQPKVDLHIDKLSGAEALVRWIHPEHGFIPPDEFIGHAEQTGLIQPLTEWGLDEALGQLATWRERGIDIAVAVNLSARSLHEQRLPSWVRERLEDWKIPTNRLILEITESAIMRDPEGALANIRALSDLGLKLSIDDFGTGYSSLGYLKTLPVHELKIDKSFVMSMQESLPDAVIVRSTIELAHNLGLRVVAEGIESEWHLSALKKLDCDIAQGYHISRPLAPADFEAWARTCRWSPVEAPAAPALPDGTGDDAVTAAGF